MIIPDSFSINKQISNFIKILLVVAEVFHADIRTERWKDGRIDMRKPSVPFLSFANAPKNYWAVCKNT